MSYSSDAARLTVTLKDGNEKFYDKLFLWVYNKLEKCHYTFM